MLDGIQTSKMVSRLNSENLEYLPTLILASILASILQIRNFEKKIDLKLSALWLKFMYVF